MNRLPRCLAVLAVLAYPAGLWSHHRALGIEAATALGVAAVASYAAAQRARRRAEQLTRIAATIAGVLGQPVRLGKPTRWHSRQLEQIVVSYPPETDDTNTALRARLLTAVTARMGGPVQVRWNPQRAMLLVRRVPPTVAESPKPEPVEPPQKAPSPPVLRILPNPDTRPNPSP